MTLIIHPLSSAKLKERVELCFCSSCGPSRLVLGWTFTFYDGTNCLGMLFIVSHCLGSETIDCRCVQLYESLNNKGRKASKLPCKKFRLHDFHMHNFTMIWSSYMRYEVLDCCHAVHTGPSLDLTSMVYRISDISSRSVYVTITYDFNVF